MSTTPEKKEESEYESESESGSESGVEEVVGAEDAIDLAEYESEDEGEIDPVGIMVELLETALITPEGETVCSALVNVGRQIEIQNKIMVKLLTTLQKNWA